MLEGVDGRVVPRPAVESVCESGSKGSSARYTNRDGATQLLPLLEEALMAVETRSRATSERRRHGATMVLESLRELAKMAVALEPLREEALTTRESHVGANTEQWEKASETRGGDDGAGASAGRGADDRGISRGSECRAVGKASEARGGDDGA